MIRRGASIALPRSPASFSSGSEVPQIFTRKSRVQPKEILITSAKRLLQQHRSQPEKLDVSISGLLLPPKAVVRADMSPIAAGDGKSGDFTEVVTSDAIFG